MKLAQLEKRHAAYKRAQRKTVVQRNESATRIKQIAAEWEQKKQSLQNQLQHDQRLQLQLDRLRECGRFDFYEAYTVERLRVGEVIQQIENECSEYAKAHRAQVEQAVSLARRQRLVESKLELIANRKSCILDEARLDEHMIFESNRHD